MLFLSRKNRKSKKGVTKKNIIFHFDVNMQLYVFRLFFGIFFCSDKTFFIFCIENFAEIIEKFGSVNKFCNFFPLSLMENFFKLYMTTQNFLRNNFLKWVRSLFIFAMVVLYKKWKDFWLKQFYYLFFISISLVTIVIVTVIIVIVFTQNFLFFSYCNVYSESWRSIWSFNFYINFAISFSCFYSYCYVKLTTFTLLFIPITTMFTTL